MLEQRAKGPRPDIIGADQPQPVDPVGLGEVAYIGRSVVHLISFAQPEIAINLFECVPCLKPAWPGTAPP
jgi:hypothetical protein